MTDRLNRITLLLIGLALAVLGAAGLAARVGRLALDGPGTIYRRLGDVAPPTVLPGLVLVAMLIAVVLAARVLLGQLRARQEPSAQAVVIERTERGVTQVDGAAVAGAVTDACSRINGVSSASASLVNPGRPTLLMRLSLTAGTRTDQVAGDVGEVLQNARRSLSDDALTAEVRVRHTTAQPPRVH